MDAPPVQYVKTSDGYTIAYAITGGGDPWVIVPPGFHHLHLVLQEASIRPWIEGLSQRSTLVRYDGRGQGLSTRGLGASHTMSDTDRDLDAVLQKLNLPPVILHGIGSSAHSAARYAARNPDRVRAVVLTHCSVTSEPWSPALMQTLANADWEVFIETMTRADRSLEEARASRDRLRQMVNREDFALMHRAYSESRIAEDLARLEVPTLVLHLRGIDRPSLQQSADVAARIPNATLAEIDASPAPWFWGSFDSAIGVIERFLADAGQLQKPEDASPGAGSHADARLSERELEVLRLLAAGRSNQQIADELVISVNTVTRHVSNIFDKTGVANRAQATAYAKDHGIA
jgi:DNA-binding CsgD family transcriptional regulator/pimeloyl-ACP methyl ester carboxylesterase